MCATGLSTIASRASRGGAGCAARGLTRWRAVARQESGANVLEMAFIAVFLLILTAGIVDLGGAYHDYIIALNASREGARLYARSPCTSSTDRAALKSDIVKAAQVGASGFYTTTLVPTANITLSPNPSSACPANGSTVRVTVQINYTTTMGQFWGATTFPIRAQTSMMFYGN